MAVVVIVMGAAAVASASASAAAGWTLYLADTYVPTGGGAVQTINTANNQLGNTTTFTGARGALDIAITPNGKTAYVTDSASFYVTPIDTATQAAGSPIIVGNHPKGIAITPDGTRACVVNGGDGTVMPINLATNTAGSPISVRTGSGLGPQGIAITPDGKTAYVANFDDGTVTPINLATNTAGSAIPVGSGAGSGPWGITITPNGKTAYVTNFNDGTVSPIDLGTNTAGSAITVGSAPEELAITPDGKTAYVANGGSTTVTPINLATNTAGSAITVTSTAGGPRGVAITPDGKTAYVSVSNNSVMPIDTATNTPGAAISIGTSNAAPLGLAILPDQVPTAALTATTARAGSASSFNAAGSSSPVGTIASYAWNFGDGQMATTSTPTTTHVYAASGSYTVRLTVTNSGGTSVSQVFTGQTVSRQGGPQATTIGLITVQPAPPGTPPGTPPRTFPSVTGLTQSHSVWREGSKLATLSRRRPPIGTTFSFGLNEKASLSLTFFRARSGRRATRGCVAPTKRLRHKRACTRLLKAGTLSFSGHPGVNTVSFQGRISRPKRLKPGRYTLAVVASAGGTTSRSATVSFTSQRAELPGCLVQCLRELAPRVDV